MIRLTPVATNTPLDRHVRAVVTRPIVVALVCGLIAAAVAPARAAWVGNELTPRTYKADGATGVLYTNFVPMPDDGIVDSLGMYFQGYQEYPAGSGTPSVPFSMYQLRPTGTTNQYNVVYASGPITPSGDVNSILDTPLPNGPTFVKSGDIFAHYGRGTPYSVSGGLNADNAHNIYYTCPAAPVEGSDITLGVAPFPTYGSSRDYAWAVQHERTIGNELTPRTTASDGATAKVFYTNFVPMPGELSVDGVSLYCQGSDFTFSIFQLRPTGTANEYDVVYDSGLLTAPGSSDTIETLLFPNGPTVTQPGDIFGHYGAGIPYSQAPSGLNINNGQAIYYVSPLAPVQGNAILLGSAAFPYDATRVRDYAWAVHVVPEPSTLLLLLLGSAGLFARGRRRRR